MTFSRSFFFSSGDINIDKKNWKRQAQRVVYSCSVAHKYIDKEQSPVTKHIASVKMSLMQKGQISID